jgi:hypothetical protein
MRTPDLSRLFIVLAVTGMSLFASSHSLAQEDAAQAVRWSWRLDPADAAPGTEADLVIQATLAPDWVFYSSDFKAPVGPRPARLVAIPGSPLDFLGPLRSIEAKRKRDTSLDIEYGYFSHRAELRQRVRVPADGRLATTLRGQACHEADGTCHLIRQDISITGTH